MTDLRLVAFDVDGTLVDSRSFILAGFRSAYEALGLVCPEDAQVSSIVGLSLETGIAELSPELSPAQHVALAKAYRDVYRRGRAVPPPPLFPGAREVLDALSAQPEVVLAVATAKSRRGLDHVLDGHGLARMFLSIQTADNHPSKPHPSMLEAVLAETGTEAAQAVMVGDTEFDIAMGRAADYRTVGVTWGHHSRERLHDAGADVVIDDFGALLPALDAFRGAA